MIRGLPDGERKRAKLAPCDDIMDKLPFPEGIIKETKPAPPSNSNRVRLLREMSADYTTIRLEVSPRHSTCKTCGKRIFAGKKRYKVLRLGQWTCIYHVRCSPAWVKKFVREYATRDFKKEALDKLLESIDEGFSDFMYQEPTADDLWAARLRILNHIESFFFTHNTVAPGEV